MMRVFTINTSAFFLFALGLGLSAVVSAQDSVHDLSPQALSALEAELFVWKSSSAGEIAKQNGFLPGSTSGMSIMDVDAIQNKELQRLLDAKRDIERIQKTQPNAQFSLDTPFALMTPAEFTAYVGRGLAKRPDLPKSDIATTRAVNRTLFEETEKRALASLPATVDWQNYGCVTPPKDQGACGTCVAFATTAAVESGACINSGAAKTLLELSQQDQISCGIYGGDCTKGQYLQNAMDWIVRLNGGSLCTSQSFPLVSAKTTTCKLFESEAVTCKKPDLNVVGYGGESSVSYNTAAMMEKLAAQPLAVEINAVLLHHYKSGIVMGDADACDVFTDHAVLLTGYGEENGVQYWRAKNSWGPTWGENGYFKIERGPKSIPMGACGVEYRYAYPIFASDAPIVAARRASAFKHNVMFLGPFFGNTYALDAADCSEQCRITEGCVAFSYGDNGFCQRLSAVDNESPSSNIQSGRMLTRAQTDQQCLSPEWHFDFPGNDIRTAQVPSYTDCCDLCNKVDNCGAYTWTKFHGGSCYLKSKKSKSVWKGANSDGSAYFIAAEVYKCQPLIQNTDLTGTDIGNVQATRAESCCAECRAVDGCTGFTWTNYNGGTCWLKSGTFTQVANTGAVSGFV